MGPHGIEVHQERAVQRLRLNSCLSSVTSAKACFSRRFSSSRSRNRLASSIFNPPNFARQR